MKFLLVGINAKYLHSNLAVYSLKTYADKMLSREGAGPAGKEPAPAGAKPDALIEVAEFTINQRAEEIVKEIYLRKPDFIGFSCYIWNIALIGEVSATLARLLTHVPVWLGGPEVSFHSGEILAKMPQVAGIIRGEGEETFLEIVRYYCKGGRPLEEIAGICFRSQGRFIRTKERAPLSFDELPFIYGRGADGEGTRPHVPDGRGSYAGVSIADFRHRIIYYEASRGCPFHCAYCLSSVEKSLRFRDLELVKEELLFFMEEEVPQVKFVDRTFNCDHKRFLEILGFLKAHDNGITNFHFEVAADLLTEEEIELLMSLRPGLVQLEIGVQSTNIGTLAICGRKTDLGKVREHTKRLMENRNIHLHLDLIAGLPGEGLESFIRSFNEVYAMGGDELQLGFLKLLKGSPMEALAGEYGITASGYPPYEVLYTNDLSYDELLLLKEVEEMLEIYHNSGQFANTEKFILPADAFSFYRDLAAFYKKKQEPVVNSSRLRRYELLLEFILETFRPEEAAEGIFRELLTLDYYQRENAKARPGFAFPLAEYKDAVYGFYKKEAEEHNYLKGYEEYDWKQLMRMTHLEILNYAAPDGADAYLFDYKQRNPVTGGAGMLALKLRTASDQEAEAGVAALRMSGPQTACGNVPFAAGCGCPPGQTTKDEEGDLE